MVSGRCGEFRLPLLGFLVLLQLAFTFSNLGGANSSCW